jgi:hypothetical protein
MMTDGDASEFPIVYSLQGGPSSDGRMLLVEATAFDGSVVRFGLPADNVKHVIAFLLVWVATISAGRTNGADTGAADSEAALPIPATSIAVGAPDGSEGYLGISVGRADLVFSLPLAAFGPLGQSLILAGTPSTLPS